jgi:hypothetical protein
LAVSDLQDRTMKDTKEQISVKLDPELKAAAEEHRSVSAQIRHFVASAIEARTACHSAASCSAFRSCVM